MISRVKKITIFLSPIKCSFRHSISNELQHRTSIMEGKQRLKCLPYELKRKSLYSGLLCEA